MSATPAPAQPIAQTLTPQQEALSMTVYDMPGESSQHQPAQPKKNGRIKLLAILLVCAAPVLASYFTYYVVRPEGRRNYGELVQPLRQLPALPIEPALPATTGATGMTMQDLRGQWLLISVAGGACDAACEKHLYLQRQMRESMNKDKARWDWVWLINDSAEIPAKLGTGLAQASVWRTAPSALTNWLALQTGDDIHQYLYVVDPMGNYMMRFPKALDAKKAIRDMERLMRASSSWDKAGRDPAAKRPE